jgi:hypothetical protein
LAIGNWELAITDIAVESLTYSIKNNPAVNLFDFSQPFQRNCEGAKA